MSVILGILDEERERLKEAKKLYEARLKKLPKGSLRERRRGEKVYIYRLFREGRRVCTRYVGVEGSAKVKELQKQLMERKQVQDFMRGVKSDLRILSRVQRARKKG